MNKNVINTLAYLLETKSITWDAILRNLNPMVAKNLFDYLLVSGYIDYPTSKRYSDIISSDIVWNKILKDVKGAQMIAILTSLNNEGLLDLNVWINVYFSLSGRNMADRSNMNSDIDDLNLMVKESISAINNHKQNM